MHLRKIGQEEKEAVAALYDAVRGRGFCTWDADYPGSFEIENDFAHGGLYVFVRGKEIVGAISVEGINELDGLAVWKCREKAAELARLVISPGEQGKGLSSLLLEKTERILTAKGFSAVHLLAACENIPAVALYRSAGYQNRGEVEMYGLHFYAFEKALL